MAKAKDVLRKFALGFVGGMPTGGWAGGFTGGTAAAVTGGEFKPLKSAAIGAGAGFVGGYLARSLDWQGDTTSIGGLTYKPLSSTAFNFLNAAKPGDVGPRLPDNRFTSGALGSVLSGLFAGGAEYTGGAPLDLPPGSGPVGSYPLASDYQAAAEASEGGGSWLPVAIAVGALVFLGAKP
ncbi:MAG: hypothetical protein H3C68_01480 [Deltaproteobacteria bacterium]|nr:hypothetical protein [Deltaproteobacteria bacterium]MBZ0219074.1 hypothetical protein [Deltaproteobacteria bacterium]